MITAKKISIYKKYDGDIDGWARSGSKSEQMEIEDADCYIIENLLQDLRLVSKGLASNEYSEALHERIQSNCSDAEAIEKLKSLIGQGEASNKQTFLTKISNIFKRKD